MLNYNLLNRIALSALGSSEANDNGGWKDPNDNNEYVIHGLNDGVAFLDISDPAVVRYIGKLPTATESSIWRDIKIYNNHAFIVSEASGHGLQVFDLTRLRNQTDFQRFTADAQLTSFGRAHNIAINEASGFAYVIGARTGSTFNYSGGLFLLTLTIQPNPLRWEAMQIHLIPTTRI